MVALSSSVPEQVRIWYDPPGAFQAGLAEAWRVVGPEVGLVVAALVAGFLLRQHQQLVWLEGSFLVKGREHALSLEVPEHVASASAGQSSHPGAIRHFPGRVLSPVVRFPVPLFVPDRT